MNPTDELSDLPPEPAAPQVEVVSPAAPPLTAAQDAAAFVARIFADAGTSEPPAEAQADAAPGQAAAPSDSTATPVPAGWPLAADRPMQGQSVLILGLGASGLAMARWCVRCGAQVTVADTRAAPPQLPVLQQELPQVRFVAGAFDASLVEGQPISAVYRSPGLAPDAIAPVFVASSAQGISAGSELSLYSMALRSLRDAHGYAPAVLAVTGTNGKTTVTSLT
ncbi:MAG: UDP-N-acetylmuramoyl-L-alanine--D-glutamate ligase, partial [Giesbergeria sp.]|nr:UDP-N-acetylmuramoyl-L-alanine--D-glutamate ligase [Giesbergeria sp.]